MRGFLLLVLLFGVTTTGFAQHPFTSGGTYDPSIPTPRSVLGYELGERFTPHHLLHRYIERVAAASPRVALDTVAYTFEGREVLMVIITSEANHARLETIKGDARRIADPRAVAPAEIEAAARRLPSIVWLGYTVHGGEASGAEAALAVIYQLAAGQDADTRVILDSAVVLIDPLQNPDGHERHAQDVMRLRGEAWLPTMPDAMVHQGTWPGPRTSHYHFDLNRDWFIQSHPETRGRVFAMLEWWPHVAVDLHEMGSSSTYFFPPPMQPLNKLIHPTIQRWWDIYASANIAAFDRHGWSFFRREGYDEFFPGYGASWPIYTGAVGMTYEQASSRGGAIRRPDGTVITLREAAWHHYTTSIATALTTARNRTARIRDYIEVRRTAVSGGDRPSMRSIVFARDAQGRADSLATLLRRNGIEVQRLRQTADLGDATPYLGGRGRGARIPAGAYVVDLFQPQGHLARALLEPDAALDSLFIEEELESRRTGQEERFYDVTAWSLPLMFRVQAWWTRGLPGPLERTSDTPTTANAAPGVGAYGYAFETGAESSLRLLAALLADSVRVWHAQRRFRAAGHDFPRGAFIVRAAENDTSAPSKLQRVAAAAGAQVYPLTSSAVEAGTDLGSNSVVAVPTPRVALVGGSPFSGNSFGFAWYALDQRLRYPVATIDVNALTGRALDDLDVVVLPSVAANALDRALGDAGRDRIGAWVRAGGTLITLDGATSWLASERTNLARIRLRRDTLATDSTAGAALPAGVPGAIVRVVADTLSPLLAGVEDREFGVLVFSDRIYTAPRDFRAGEAVVKYVGEERLRIAGYLWPEVPERLAGTPYLWTESVGRGRVIAFAGDPNFRDMWRGLLPLFANAVLLAESW